ncbi:MAG: inositol monophosphatase family protein, partial [Haloarcula sp.]
MTEHRTARAALARHAATDGEVAAELFRTAVAVETKTENPDVVTEADRAAQRRVAETIAEEFPDEMLVGEESDALIVITANR